MAANQFIAISLLPDIPSFPAIGNHFVVQAAGVTYRVNARLLPMVSDSFITWGAQTTDLPGSRQLVAGLGIGLDLSTPGQAVLTWSGSGVIPDGNKGDITVSGSGITWTINASAVTLAKIQNIATSRVLGRVTGGSGVVEELTPTQLTTLVNVFNTSTSGAVPVSPGGTGTFLRADGTWNAPAGGGSVASVVGGYGIEVDASAPTNPIVHVADLVHTDAATTGAKNIDFDAGDSVCFNLTLTGNSTFTFIDPPPTGRMFTANFILRQDGAGSRIVTWPAAVDWSFGTIPTLSTAPGAIDVITMFTIDGGTTWMGAQVMAAVA